MMESIACYYYVTKLLAGEGIGKIEESEAKVGKVDVGSFLLVH